MNPDILKYLEDDIKLSIEAIERYTADLATLVDFENDEETIDSVERRLAIIGEALFKVNKLDPNPPVSDKSKITKLLHILVHEYDLINHATI